MNTAIRAEFMKWTDNLSINQLEGLLNLNKTSSSIFELTRIDNGYIFKENDITVFVTDKQLRTILSNRLFSQCKPFSTRCIITGDVYSSTNGKETFWYSVYTKHGIYVGNICDYAYENLADKEIASFIGLNLEDLQEIK